MLRVFYIRDQQPSMIFQIKWEVARAIPRKKKQLKELCGIRYIKMLKKKNPLKQSRQKCRQTGGLLIQSEAGS